MRALIPGTYDPVTFGHLDVIERSSHIFDSIVVAVAASLRKNNNGTLFSLEERVAFLEETTRRFKNVQVVSFNKLLVDFAVDMGAQVIVKGLRAVTDFESEFQQASINYQLNPALETVFVMANPANMYLSSSMVKEIAALHGDISSWVPLQVELALRKRFQNKR